VTLQTIAKPPVAAQTSPLHGREPGPMHVGSEPNREQSRWA